MSGFGLSAAANRQFATVNKWWGKKADGCAAILNRSQLFVYKVQLALEKSVLGSVMTELWACGFNAWGQLNFEEKYSLGSHDLPRFKCIHRDDSIEVLHDSISATSSRSLFLVGPIYRIFILSIH